MSSFAEYEKVALAVPVALRNNRDRLEIPVTGLQQETGRLGATLAAAFESGEFKLTPPQSEHIKDSWSDMLWYLTRLGHETGCPLEDLAAHSLAQLQLRLKEWDADQR